MAHIVITRPMPVSAQHAWKSLSDLERGAVWNCNLERVEMLGAERGLGARRAIWAYGGQRMQDEITQLDPAEMTIATDVSDVGAPVLSMRSEFRVVATGAESCEVTVECEYTLMGGVLGVALDTLVVRRAIRKSNTQLLEGLEHHLRTGDSIGDGGSRLPVPDSAAAK